MKGKELHSEFLEAFERVSQTDKVFPPDVLLQFYALYKQATKNIELPQNATGEHHLVSAFKINALFQVRNLTASQAKREYIKAANAYLND